MAKRRGNNEGTIYKAPDGRWIGQVTCGVDPTTGKPKRRSFYGKTRKEVQDKISTALQGLKTGSFIEPKKITFGEWLDRWLNDYMKTAIRQNTWESYEILVRVHIKPALGMVKLSKLHAADLQRFYNQKLESGRVKVKAREEDEPLQGDDKKEGLSTRYVRYMHSIIREALQQAVKEHLIPNNVADATSPPKSKSKPVQPLSEEQIVQFLQTAREDRLAAAFILALGTGLRRGELLGLKWECIDLEAGVITVKRELLSMNSGIKLEENLKTKSSKRSIPISSNVLKELKSHKARQAQEKLLLGKLYQDLGLVFAKEEGSFIDPKWFTKLFQKLLARAGLPRARFHDVRHSHATLLLTKGEHPKVVQERLGHSSITMTLDLYSHVAPGIQKMAADRLDNIFKEKEKNIKEAEK